MTARVLLPNGRELTAEVAEDGRSCTWFDFKARRHVTADRFTICATAVRRTI